MTGTNNQEYCPCCGKHIVEEYDICDVCGWENDPVQKSKPEMRGGANVMSLNEARIAFKTGNPVT